jgi:DNA polymerase-1
VNVQNIPRDDKAVKSAFIPKYDALLFFDYKQIEPRLLAYYMSECGFPELSNRLNAGEDVYTAIVKGMYGTDSITEEQRQIGKTQFLSLQYGGGIPTIIRQFGVPRAEARRIVDSFHNAWPGVRAIQRRLDYVCESRGYLKTLMGKRLRPNSQHKRLNVLIQGGAAEILKMALVNVYTYLNDNCLSHIVNNVHDEIQVDSVFAEIPELSRKIPTLMDYPIVSKIVPLPVDIEWTLTSWADKKPFIMEDYIARIF